MTLGVHSEFVYLVFLRWVGKRRNKRDQSSTEQMTWLSEIGIVTFGPAVDHGASHLAHPCPFSLLQVMSQGNVGILDLGGRNKK